LSKADTALQNITGLVSQGTNVTITGTGTSGDPYVINSSGGGGGTPGGSDTQLQFNNSGSFGGAAIGYSTDNTYEILSPTTEDDSIFLQGNDAGFAGLRSGDETAFLTISNSLFTASISTHKYIFQGDGATGTLDFSTSLSGDRNYAFPDASGTVALTSDIPSVTPAALTKT